MGGVNITVGEEELVVAYLNFFNPSVYIENHNKFQNLPFSQNSNQIPWNYKSCTLNAEPNCYDSDRTKKLLWVYGKILVK
jgi:hypothetical protein